MSAAWLRHSAVLWAAFLLVHLWLIWLGAVVVPGSLGDISGVYRFWMDGLFSGQFIVGVTTPWVYPLLAIVPMLVASVAGLHNYVMAWLIMVTLIDIVAFAILIHPRGSRAARPLAAWWWTLALLALGPVALGRIDSVVTPLAILGLLFLLTRPMLAGVLLAIGTWMKVWPGALIVAAVILLRRRRWIILGGVVTSVVVIAAGLVLGAGTNLFSFFGYQGTRGLQIESPAATPYLWMTSAGNKNSQIYFDQDLLTYQINGPAVALVSSVMTWVMLIAVALTLVIISLRARNSHTALAHIPAAGLALVMALIAFNKVGSPQYLCWVIPPVLLGMVLARVRFIPVAVVCLLLLLLTQLIYPWMYDGVLKAEPMALIVMTARNFLEIVLWVWSLRLLLRRA